MQGHANPGIITASEKVKYRPPKKVMELENIFSSTLSSINPK